MIVFFFKFVYDVMHSVAFWCRTWTNSNFHIGE